MLRNMLTLLSLPHTMSTGSKKNGKPRSVLNSRWMRPMRTFEHRGQRGFTLIEMLIIAALIALMSGIAVISIQYIVIESKRRATLGDLRTLAHTLTLAHYDHGIFPKLGYLSMSSELLQITAGGNTVLPPDFHDLGFNIDGQAGPLYAKWKGPYTASARGRSTISSSGQGYVVRMRMPTLNSNNETIILDWPADAFGNPYVVYLVLLRRDVNTGATVFEPLVFSSEEPNYAAYTVSYGLNRIPGGPVDRSLITPAIRSLANEFRYYTEDGSGLTDAQGRRAEFVARTFAEQNTIVASGAQRFQALGREVSPLGGFGYLSAFPEIPGITDPGSDDLFVPIP